MASDKPNNYRVDYYYSKGLSKTRTQLTGSVSQHLHNARTESAVMSYLRSKHPGYDIYLMSLEWF